MGPVRKIRYSLKLDIEWLKLRAIPFRKRIGYVAKKYVRLLKGGDAIPFLSRGRFLYDNRNTPATLQSYPAEIEFLNKWVDFKAERSVLDVGANIGQFSVTLASLFPKTKLWCFEPNPNAFRLLEQNTADVRVKRFNYGVGVPGRFPFFFVPGASAKGSFVASNAAINLGDVQTSEIQVEAVSLDTETVSRLGIPDYFDLIKIDVECFEYDVLKALSGVRAKYIYIEFSMGRSHSYSFPDLVARLQEMFGPVEILYCDAIDALDRNRTIGNILAMSTAAQRP